jgi:ATP-dependent DNA helicase RecQ
MFALIMKQPVRKFNSIETDPTYTLSDFDHLECDPEHIIGCSRCLVSQPMVCCDIHHPDHFSTYSSPTDDISATTRRSRIPKYKQEASDLALLDALYDWREEKTISIYGWAHLSDLGPSLVLPNSMLDRIVDCAHHRKIHSVLELKKETGWTDADRFGNEVVLLIQSLAPPGASPFAMTPLSRTPSASNTIVLPPTPSTPSPCLATTSNAPKRKNKCSACGQEGHNGECLADCIQILKIFIR